MDYVTCPKCNEENSGSTLYCVRCGTKLSGVQRTRTELPAPVQPAVPGQPGAEPRYQTSTYSSSSSSSLSSREVIVTDISMSFGSMVAFMVKWTLASIPAFIILVIIAYVVLAVVGVGILGIFR